MNNKQKQKINEQSGQQKTIFDYVTDNSMYVNNSQCFNSTPPFISYIPVGVQNKNVDIENDLRGTNRLLTKCNENKYIPDNLTTIQTFNPEKKYNLNECKNDNRIINKYMSNQ